MHNLRFRNGTQFKPAQDLWQKRAQTRVTIRPVSQLAASDKPVTFGRRSTQSANTARARRFSFSRLTGLI
jgi:hypothetical protein